MVGRRNLLFGQRAYFRGKLAVSLREGKYDDVQGNVSGETSSISFFSGQYIIDTYVYIF